MVLFFARLQSGSTVTVRRYSRVLQWFSDNWPLDLGWPADIPRPDPAEDSPYIQALAEQVQHLNNSANDSESDPESTDDPDPFALNDKGQLASPQALATSFHADAIRNGRDPSALIHGTLDIYYQVVRQYADGKPRALQAPREGTQAETILVALMAAGDVRFAERIVRQAEQMAEQEQQRETERERAAVRLGYRG